VPRENLDVAAGWPLREVARRALVDALAVTDGDPQRPHLEGETTRQLLAAATATTAELLGASDEDVVWTSGGTEAANLAVTGPVRAARQRGADRAGLVVSAVEHSAVLDSARRLATDGLVELREVPVDAAGVVDLGALAAAVDDDTVAVHVQHANHEVGTLQPTHEVARICRAHGALLHVDACQTVGQLGVTLEQLGADLLSLSATKFGGPRGVGALVLGPRARLAPALVGDDRQRGRRAGRLPVAAIAAAAVALDEAVATMERDRSARELVRRHLRDGLQQCEDVAVHGPLAEAHPGIVAASALYVAGDALADRLDDRGWAVASGSSCAVRSGEPPHVLVAMRALTHGHLRISFGPDLEVPTADAFLADYREVVADLRAQSGRRTT
jgi:cysteine desulfurase